MPAPQATWQSEFAQWIVALRYDDLPRDVVVAALRSIVDVVGVGLAGSRTDVGRIVAERVRGRCAVEAATAIGFDFRAGCPEAALLNATASHALDFDDTSGSLIGHSSAVVFPAALAAAEGAGAEVSGRDLVVAFVAGTEVACRLGSALSGRLFRAGWFTTAALGTFGAAGAAAKIWGLRTDEVEAAMAIAGGYAGGIRANNGTMAKAIQCGSAARMGLEAADLARAGAGAATDIFQGHDGYLSVHGLREELKDRASWRLGNPYELVSPGMAIKRYPCCSAIAAAVDAVLALRSEAGFDWEGVRILECETTELAKQSLPYVYPSTWREAQFSLHYCLAWAMVFGKLDLSAFGGDPRDNASVRRAMGRVRVSYGLDDPSGRSEGAAVRMQMRDGRAFERTVSHAVGTPENPLTDEDIFGKFRACASRADMQFDADCILDVLWHLSDHSLADVSHCLRRTRADPKKRATRIT
ncbi:MAG: MmgE/PrpD family protein [Rhodospirillales bacterium]|nr:MmgE/PrpD family protein [Rhodospirillales bacterium]